MRQSVILEDLRAKIARIEGVAARNDVIPFGLDAIDSRIPAGDDTQTCHDTPGRRPYPWAGAFVT